MFTTLKLTHLRFDVIALDPIKLDEHLAGNNLRNALANVMLRTTCPQAKGNAPPTPEHAATCPACWLLAAEIEPGTVVRAYTLVPPLPPRDLVQPGECFSFALTLFGDSDPFLPYFVLAVAEAGQDGVGPGRGRFQLDAIWAFDSFTGRRELVKAPGDPLVHVPRLQVDHTAVSHYTNAFLSDLRPGGELTLRFLTPLRLEARGRRFKTPDFSVFFRRLLYRIDELGRHFAGQTRRDRDQVKQLNHLADQVYLVESRTRWHELWSASGRKRRRNKTPLGGLVGSATYWAETWAPLLPWLLLGQAVQAGKAATKGNGVYELHTAGEPGYWSWVREW